MWRDEDETGGEDITPGHLLILTPCLPCLPLPLLFDASGVVRGVQWKECIKDFWRFFSQHHSIFLFILFYFLATIVPSSSSSLWVLIEWRWTEALVLMIASLYTFISGEAISSATFTLFCSFLVDFPFTARGNLISLICNEKREGDKLFLCRIEEKLKKLSMQTYMKSRGRSRSSSFPRC